MSGTFVYFHSQSLSKVCLHSISNSKCRHNYAHNYVIFVCLDLILLYILLVNLYLKCVYILLLAMVNVYAHALFICLSHTFVYSPSSNP